MLAGLRGAPVQVAHQLVAKERLAAPRQADQDDDELLAVNAQLALAADAPAHHPLTALDNIARLRLVLRVIAGGYNDILEVDMRAVLWGPRVRELLRNIWQPACRIQSSTCCVCISLPKLMLVTSQGCHHACWQSKFRRRRALKKCHASSGASAVAAKSPIQSSLHRLNQILALHCPGGRVLSRRTSGTAGTTDT